ncbi:hypothetical protein [Streptomyces sp. enrichment culture]|uniref:hypothetical protein n=1 Tax=Streptomyces sp. enrichment culture TaxID=1795815 RepID=UPI003F57630B
MGRAFVAKLARQGARDPEALAAWIGRQKHGKTAFQRLAKAGRDDAKEQRRVMARVRPGGHLAGDLTGISDRDLGRALSALSTDEGARVAAELDRRDVAARLPGARADLIGESDEDLGRRLATADAAESAAIAAEMDRRQMVAEVFPGGSLAGDLSGVDEDKLGRALAYAQPGETERIAAEMDRRHPPQPLPAATGDQLADRAAMDALLGPMSPDDWASLAEDPPDRFEGMSSTERWIAEREEEAEAARGAYTRQQVRDMYAAHIYTQLLDAEQATHGILLTRQAHAQGVDPISLFTGPSHVAFARASEELKRWWQDNPRITLAEYEEQITGQRSAAGERARQSRHFQQSRW